MEIFNEICILIVAYILIIFSDFIPSLDLKVQASYLVIGVTLTNFLVNLILMVVGFIDRVKAGYKKLMNMIS